MFRQTFELINMYTFLFIVDSRYALFLTSIRIAIILNFEENENEYFNISINNQNKRKCFASYIVHKRSLRRINI